MKTASIAQLKAELQHIPPNELIALCLRMAKYKKENKELLSYLLFESRDEQAFIEAVKAQIDEEFKALNTHQLYLAKKTIRKVLRTTNKFIRFAASKQVEVELRLYFCQKMKDSSLRFKASAVLYNLYLRQLQLIRQAVNALHEDLQHDYAGEIEALIL